MGNGPLTIVEQATALFNKQCRPYQYSGFGFPKRTELADAYAKDSLVVVDDESRTVKLAAIVKTLKHDQSHKDFRGQHITMPKGDVFVSDIAVADDVPDEDVAAFLSSFVPKDNLLGDGALWIEVYQEHPRWQRFMKAYDYHPAGWKIMAGSEIKVIYCSMDPSAGSADGFSLLDPADVPVLKMILPEFLSPTQLALVRDELSGWSGFENHYSIYNETDSWSAFALKGFKKSDPNYIIKPTEMSKKWRAANPNDLIKYTMPEWTVAANKFPETVRFIKAYCHGLDTHPERVRFMRLLGGGGKLGRHTDITDRFAGTSDLKLTRLHVPIYTSDAVTVQGWELDGKRTDQKWHEGGLFYLDQRKPHEVINNDPNLSRIHLVFDVYSNERVRELLR